MSEITAPQSPVELQVQVKGQNPLQSGIPVFSNFLAVSHAGNDVQFEFIFLDLNQIAQTIQANQAKKEPKAEGPINMDGRTVVKVVMPALSVLQLKDHLIALLQNMEKQQKDFLSFVESKNVTTRASSR